MQDHKPYFDEQGDLVVPLHCPEKYKWWKNTLLAKGSGEYWKQDQDSAYLRIDQILKELKVSREIWEKYTHLPYDGPWE